MTHFRRVWIPALIAGFGAAAALPARAQDSAFLPAPAFRLLVDEISGDRAFNVVRRLTPYHRIMGSQAFLDAAGFLAGLARESGLTNVAVVTQKFEGGMSWNPRSAVLRMIEPETEKLADFADVAVSLAVFSRTAHAAAELVDIGGRTSAAELADLDVAGKIVLTTASPAAAMRTAVWGKGALGVVSCASIHADTAFDNPDQVAYIKVPMAAPPGKAAPWAFMISPRQYGRLQGVLRNAKTAGRPVKVRADIEADVREPAEQGYLWAEIEGASIHDQDIVLTAHLDEESTSANDNGSGCASQLEIGRAINALIAAGKMPRPKRDIVFWWPNEHTSEYQYLREHPEAPRGWLAAINQDMVGARQSQGSRVQHIIRTPFSLPSYLNDVIESIVDSLVLGNSGSMGAEEAGIPQPFSKPVLAFLGSRERYDALVVPHSGGSDHEVFCEGVVRVPGVALINNPDAYIHSSDDDLGNIDRTQLKRNALVVAAVALFVANAGDEEVPLLVQEVHARGVARLGRDLITALAYLRKAEAKDRPRAYHEALNLLDQAVAREKGALSSIQVFAAPGGKNAALPAGRMRSIDRLAATLREDLAAAYAALTGETKIPVVAPSALEREMAGKVPINVASLDEYFSKRGWGVSFPGLHPIIAKECYAFVDGRRSYLDIFRAVQAEAMTAGEFYYGRVEADRVQALLDQAVQRGVLKLR
ncbi:MAG: M28 family peptidase [Candidatus Aminicenantes bacterium]|nr:M28 family peptidase [Candidatus Aminicenantes bacterium]